MTTLNQFKILPNLVYKIVLFIGVFLSIFQLINARGLWLDEASLALNIIELDYKGLLGQLKYEQVAPIIFLLFVKLISFCFNYSEIGLRLVPFVCYLISCRLIFTISNQILSTTLAKSIFIGTLLFNPYVIFYASELKQYMTEFMWSCVAIKIILDAKKTTNADKANLWPLLLFGVVGFYISNTQSMVVAGIALYLLISSAIRWKNKSFILVAWTISFITFYMLVVKGHSTKDFMTDYWGDAFLPNNPFTLEFWIFLKAKVSMVFQNFLISHGFLGGILFACFLIGLVVGIDSNKEIIAVTITIFGTHLFLSSLKLYPFEGRLILYLLPFIMIVISIALDYLVKTALATTDGYHSLLSWVYLIGISLLLVKQGYPITAKQDVKPLIEFINIKHKNSDDFLYHVGSDRIINYYVATNRLKSGNFSSFTSTSNIANNLSQMNSNTVTWALMCRDGMSSSEVMSLATKYHVRIIHYQVCSGCKLYAFKLNNQE